MALLDVQNIIAGYGETEILHSVSIQVNEGNLVAIIGPNGSGKSTLLKVIVGLLEAKNGNIKFMSDNITNSSYTGETRFSINVQHASTSSTLSLGFTPSSNSPE